MATGTGACCCGLLRAPFGRSRRRLAAYRRDKAIGCGASVVRPEQ